MNNKVQNYMLIKPDVEFKWSRCELKNNSTSVTIDTIHFPDS